MKKQQYIKYYNYFSSEYYKPVKPLIDSAFFCQRGKIEILKSGNNILIQVLYGNFVIIVFTAINNKFKEFLMKLPARKMIISDKYQLIFEKNNNLMLFDRFYYNYDNLSIKYLNNLIITNNNDFIIRKIRMDDYDNLKELDINFVGEFCDKNDFESNYLGFCVSNREDGIICCAGSYAHCNDKIDIQITTHKNYRNRGLAKYTCAYLLKFCLENNIKPYWSAANKKSCFLAESLGYRLEKKIKVLWKD